MSEPSPREIEIVQEKTLIISNFQQDIIKNLQDSGPKSIFYDWLLENGFGQEVENIENALTAKFPFIKESGNILKCQVAFWFGKQQSFATWLACFPKELHLDDPVQQKRWQEYLEDFSHFLEIDRSPDQKLNPATSPLFPASSNYSIWRGAPHSSGQDPDQPEDQDLRSLAIDRLDLRQVQFVTKFRKGEQGLAAGEIILRRLKKNTNIIHLDAKIAEILDQIIQQDQNKNPGFIPESWKKMSSIRADENCASFGGTIFRSEDGDREVIQLIFHFDLKEWQLFIRELHGTFSRNESFAVLILNENELKS